MKISWSQAIHQLSEAGQGYVIATLISTRGSTPRNSGSKMVITKDAIYDTVGGGHLEHKIIQQANQLLLQNNTRQQIKQFDLGIHLDQCCGGSTHVLFESFQQEQVNIMLFGAGHVGQALIPLLASLPCHITWVDNRSSQFPASLEKFNNIDTLVSAQPAMEVVKMPSASFYIVLTHKHQLDFDICSQILLRDDAAYLGLIGSKTKWRRFSRRFLRDGFSQKQIDQINCPIGLADVKGKLPAEIAIAIAAQVIATYTALNNNHQPQKKTKANKLGVLKQDLDELAL